MFRVPISDYFSGWLFGITVPEDYFGCLFQMTIPDYCSGWLFRMPISDDFSWWLFRITVPDEYFGCLFVIPRLILILATNSYFHGISYFNQSFDWLVPRLTRFWAMACYCRIMAPIPPDKLILEITTDSNMQGTRYFLQKRIKKC